MINGKELNSKDGVQITKDVINNTYILTIPKLNPIIHGGKLRINAKNVVGSDYHEMDINIQGYLKCSYFVLVIIL